MKDKVHFFSYEHLNKLFPGKKAFFVIWGLLFVCMLPYYLAFFPGIFGYDTPVQMSMFYGEYPLSTHHPLAHTILVGCFFKLGEFLFNSAAVGFGLYIIFQWILVSNALAVGFHRLYLRRISGFILCLSLIWTLVLCPALMVLSFNSTKDVLFGVFLLYFFFALWDFFDAVNKGEKVKTQTYIRLCSFAILSCLFRNQGVYIILVFAVIILLAGRQYKKILIPLVVSVIISLGFSFIATTFCHVEKGDMKEMLCVPMMQISYTVNQHRLGADVSVSADDLALVYELIPEEAFVTSDGNWDSADYFKAYFNTAKFKSDLPGFLGLYFRLGFTNPGEYIHAFNKMVLPYFSMGKCNYRGLMFDQNFTENVPINIEVNSVIPIFRKATHFYITRLPGYFFILEPGIGIYILLAGIIIGVVKKKRGLVLLFLPHLLYFGTCLLGPIALIRYLYPIMLVTPFALGYLFDKN